MFVDTENPDWIQWDTFPYDMLQKRYQALLIKHLKEQIQKNIDSKEPDPDLKVFSVSSVMKAFFDDLKKQYQFGFFVHITEERCDLKQTASYVARYARRPHLSELRIKGYTGAMVTFEFKDYLNGGSKCLYTLKTIKFLRKLVRHIPPHYFNVIRHYGLMASRVKSMYKAITTKLLGETPNVKPAQSWRERQTEFRGEDPLLCKTCNRVMEFVSAHLPTPLAKIKSKFQAIFA